MISLYRTATPCLNATMYWYTSGMLAQMERKLDRELSLLAGFNAYTRTRILNALADCGITTWEKLSTTTLDEWRQASFFYRLICYDLFFYCRGQGTGGIDVLRSQGRWWWACPAPTQGEGGQEGNKKQLQVTDLLPKKHEEVPEDLKDEKKLGSGHLNSLDMLRIGVLVLVPVVGV